MKKINSEIKIDNNTFKIKIGTVDKKKPTTIYFVIGTYITPLETNDDFCGSIEKIKKQIGKLINNVINDSKYIQNNHIFVTDVPVDRIMYNKQSYFETSLYLKTESYVTDTLKYNFNQIAKNLNDDLLDKILDVLKHEIINAGYHISKNKYA